MSFLKVQYRKTRFSDRLRSLWLWWPCLSIPTVSQLCSQPASRCTPSPDLRPREGGQCPKARGFCSESCQASWGHQALRSNQLGVQLTWDQQCQKWPVALPWLWDEYIPKEQPRGGGRRSHPLEAQSSWPRLQLAFNRSSSVLRNDPGQCHRRAMAVLSGLMWNLFPWRRSSGSAAPARTDWGLCGFGDPA